MNPPTPRRKDGRFYVRMETDELDRLRRIARSRGLSLTELLRYRLRDQTLPDRSLEREILASLDPIIRELQYIGHNINQATAALHRANLRRLPIGPELDRFNRLLDTYLSTRDTLRASLGQLLDR